jgi:hypothetical protein
MRYDAFGDECGSDAWATYGFVCVAEPAVAGLISQLSEIRERWGLGAARLHCRELFHVEKRRKLGLAELLAKDILSIYSEVTDAMSEHASSLSIAVADLKEFPSEYPADRPFPRVVFGRKQLGVWCANAAALPLFERLREEDLRFWVDRDATKIEWLGGNRQASRAVGGYVDLGPNMAPPRFEPQELRNLEADGRVEIFQCADFLAWAASHHQLRCRDRSISQRMFSCNGTSEPNDIGHRCHAS